MTVEQVLTEVLQDLAFYETSAGGVTLSGGEPLWQIDFSRTLLQACKQAGLHTAIETCGDGPWQDLSTLLPATDLVMVDIKHMDAEKHRAATGRDNTRILSNARQLAQTDKPILFRVPVVPTVNDQPEEIAAIAQFVTGLRMLRPQQAGIGLELLTFHQMAGEKYRSLGLTWQTSALVPLSAEKMAALQSILTAAGF